MLQLTQKETDLLKDMKDQERLCADKYTRHAQCACDPQLKNLFSQIATVENEHWNTLDQICRGTVPVPSGGSAEKPEFTAADPSCCPAQCDDKYLCSDALATEKHASHLYDTCIFEFADANVRSLLNHIQKEEQEHGKMIYDYMAVNCMYC
ncbi:MAG: spore coat protein [Clostridia bacterium]|nr:spore coat protein [Clostridia bacterium]MBQ5820937.1 spore coat protein [Clostridia bacterium]